MNLSSVTLLSAALILTSATGRTESAPSAEQTQRVAAAYVLALGRVPSAAEFAQCAEAGPLPVAELITRLRGRLASDPAVKRAAVIKAAEDAFGETPTEEKITRWSDGTQTYTELMRRHIAWLTAHPRYFFHEQVVQHAYQFVLRRAPYPSEVKYWKKRGVLPYALLVACLENWARRNQPGLMETSGEATVSVNSEFLTAIWLSPAVAAEARAAAGLPAAPPGHTVIAAGAAGIVTDGGMFLTAAGADNVAAP